MTWAIYLTGAVTTFLVVVAVVKPWRYPKAPAPDRTTLGEMMEMHSGDWWLVCIGFAAGWFVTVTVSLLAGVFILFVAGTMKLLDLIDKTSRKGP